MSNNTTPFGFPIATARKVTPLRQRMIEELRTEHYTLLPEAGQLLCSAFWQVTGSLRYGRDPQLPDLLGQGKESGDQQPDSGLQRPSVSLPRDFETGSGHRNDPVPQARIPAARDP